MIIRILLSVIVIILFVVANYFKKNKDNFSQVLANDKPKEPIAKVFGTFGKACFILAIIGIPVLLYGHKTIALIYVAVVMAISAVFSVKLTKVI